MRDPPAHTGFTPTIADPNDLLDNPIAGKRRGVRYTGDFGVDLKVDLER